MFLDKLFKKKLNNYSIQTTFGEPFEGEEPVFEQGSELLTATVGNFKIRTTKPAKTDKFISYYIHRGSSCNGIAGKSYCIIGKPTDSAANCLSNCVG